ncbi:MAG: hypothetical protein JST82_02495 [Bacteroidetes bacterium]|nr:hypothetical protein [Bacteroidota bacterium]
MKRNNIVSNSKLLTRLQGIGNNCNTMPVYENLNNAKYDAAGICNGGGASAVVIERM